MGYPQCQAGWAITVWLLLNLLDWVVSTVHFSLNGLEANALLANMNGIGFAVAKIGMPLLLAVVLWRVRRLRWLWAFSAGMLVIVGWNAQWFLLKI